MKDKVSGALTSTNFSAESDSDVTHGAMLEIVNSPFSASPVSLARIYSHNQEAPARQRAATANAAEQNASSSSEQLLSLTAYSTPTGVRGYGKITGVKFSFAGGRAVCFGPCKGRADPFSLAGGEFVQRVAGRVDMARSAPCLVMLQVTTSHRREHFFGLSHHGRGCAPFSYSAPWGEEIIALRLSASAASPVICGVETRTCAVHQGGGGQLRVVDVAPPGRAAGRARLFDDQTAAQEALEKLSFRMCDLLAMLKLLGGGTLRV